MRKKYLLVIPARYHSSRLPGKPLINLKGIPMIIRTCIQCSKVVPKKNIIVATDDKRILKICESFGFNCHLTKKKCLTGTDRVGEIAKIIKAEYYINVQGDEPIFNPQDILKLLEKIQKKHKDVLLGFTELKQKNLINNKNIPKVFFDKNFNLLFASRNPIFNKKKSQKHFRQVLAYSFPREKLNIFTKVKKRTFFENKEDIEILRFLELGVNVQLIKMSNISKSVDVKSDIKLVLNKIKN